MNSVPGGSLLECLSDVRAFASRRFAGDYTVDVSGYDEDLVGNVINPAVSGLSRLLQAQVQGMEHVPSHGPVLLASGRNCLFPWETIFLKQSLKQYHPHRLIRFIAPEFVTNAPVLGALARKIGDVAPSRREVVRLLSKGEVVGVPLFDRLSPVLKWGDGFRDLVADSFVKAAVETEAALLPVAVYAPASCISGALDLLSGVLALAEDTPPGPGWRLRTPVGLRIRISPALRVTATRDDPLSIFNASRDARELINRMLVELNETPDQQYETQTG